MHHFFFVFFRYLEFSTQLCYCNQNLENWQNFGSRPPSDWLREITWLWEQIPSQPALGSRSPLGVDPPLPALEQMRHGSRSSLIGLERSMWGICSQKSCDLSKPTRGSEYREQIYSYPLQICSRGSAPKIGSETDPLAIL